MVIKRYLRTMFAALALVCVLIGVMGLAACTCLEDCQTDRDACEGGCDTTRDSCDSACQSQEDSCNNDCDSDYNSCMSGCGGDPDCEMMCDMEWGMCTGDCSMQGGQCIGDCGNAQSNCYGGCGDTYDACVAGCPPPPSITHTKGRYWVNHTWVLNCTDESVPTSYNVSINQTWHNGTATRWYNNSGLQGGVWSNAIVLAWNSTSGALCSVTLSENVYLPLPLPPAPVGMGSTWDFFWVNHTWTAGSDGEWAGDTDSFNVSIETHWINGTTKNEWVNGSLTTFYNNSLDGEYGWSNITVWSYNGTGGLNSTYIYQNVVVPVYVPPTPVNPQSTSGRFWVNHTWSPGTGHYTDSYNVSLESDGWHNGTLTAYYKEQMSSNGWSNITVYAYNSTHHELSESALTQNVQISWTNDIFVNTSGWWRDGAVFNATASEPFSRALENVTTGDSVRVYDGTYYEAAWLYAGQDDIAITPVSGQPIIYPSKQQGTLTIAGDNISISGFLFRTSLQWVIVNGYALAFYGAEDSTASNNDFIIRTTSHGDVVAIGVWNSDNCTISGGEVQVEQEGCIDIDWLSSGTTVTGTYTHAYFGSPQYGIRIARAAVSPIYQHNTISGNTIYNTGAGIEINASEGGVFDDTNVWSGNSVSGCTYGVKHDSSSITWSGSASSNTYDHYFTGDTSGSVLLNLPSLANLYLADAGSTCTITSTGGRMFDVCGTRHEYIDDLAYAYPNGTFSRHISDSSPLQALNLLFYDDFTITPASAPVSVSNIEFFGSACDATGGHDVEVDVASSTPANEVRFNITGDSSWVNDYVNMDISGTFVKREKANITSFVSILYTGGFSSHHFEFDEIYIPAGGGGANPFLNPSFECQREFGGDPSQATFCNWSQSGSCSGNAPGCGHWWEDCGTTHNSGSSVCRTGSWHTDGDYSAWIVSTIVGYDNCNPSNDCATTTTVYQSVDLTGIGTISFDARLRDRANFNVVDCGEPGTAEVLYQKAIDMYVDGTRVWRRCYGGFTHGSSEGWCGFDNTADYIEQEVDVSSYTGTHEIKLVSYIAFHGAYGADFSTIDGWMQMQGFFDNMGVLYSVQPPENLLYEACPYYVNHTWDEPTGGAVIDSYNVSVNSVWHNGTADTFYEDTSLTDWWQWSNISVYSYNTTDGLSPGNSSATVQLTPAISVPTDLAHTEGHIWIRHAWNPGTSFSCLCVPTQSYNVSVNDVWYNGTTDTFYDDTGLAYEEWSNITVYSYNSDAAILSAAMVTQELKVDTPKPPTPVGGTGTWDFFWVNHAWSAGSEPNTGATDSYNYSITTNPLGGSPSTIWYNDSTNTSHNNALGDFGWSNLTVWAWSDHYRGLSESCAYQNIEVIKYAPPNPTYIHNETDPNAQVWANFSWACDEGGRGLADSFNIRINDVWHNGTTLCDNSQPVPEDSDFEDNTLMGWTTSGSYAWAATAYGYESTYAVRDGFTGTATGSSTVWKTITLDDYGSMYFDCKLNGGTLTVYNGSETLYVLTGTHDWQSIQLNLTAGTRTIKFTYTRPTSPTPENHVWIDNVVVRQRVHGWYLASGFTDSDIDIVVWAWNNTYGGISENYTNDSVYIGRIPRTPCNINHTTGMYWVNYTWEPVEDHDDSYNVSLNGVWHNGTTDLFYNDSGRMTDWGQCSEIHVYSYNTTLGTLSNSSVSDSVCLTPTLTLWNDYTDGAHTIIETFDQLFLIEFTCSSDAEMASWDWLGEDSNGSITNSKTTNGTLFVYEWKTYIISVQGRNATGTVTARHTWTVTLTPPDDWYDPNYVFRKKVLVNMTCDTGWGNRIKKNHITVHLDTTLCAWSDCWDIFCYSKYMTGDAKLGHRWYTPRSQGYPEQTTNEEIYVQLDRVSSAYPVGGGDYVYPPWEMWIYYCNPSRTDKADAPPSSKHHCKGYGEILHINDTLTYSTIGGHYEYWQDLTGASFFTEYTHNGNTFHIGSADFIGSWMPIATTYSWYDDCTRIPYVLTQHANNSLTASTAGTYRKTSACSSAWVGRLNERHGLQLIVCDPRKTPRRTDAYRICPYSAHTIESHEPTGSIISTSTIPVYLQPCSLRPWGGYYPPYTPPGYIPDGLWGYCCGAGVGIIMRAYSYPGGYYSGGYFEGYSDWYLTQCHLTYTSEPGPLNSEACITVEDDSAPIGIPSPAIVVCDEKGNFVSGLTYMIYDEDNNEVYSPWALDGDGVIYFNDPSNRNVTLAVRTHEGVYTQGIPLTNGSLINMTIPLTYNIDIRAFDAGGRQLDETICTLSEYAVRDPGFFWGLAMGNRTSVRMRDLSSFGVCGMTVEKAGYGQYNETELDWTTQSTMISDYKQDVTLTTE